jgi:NAD(P)H-dependent flavin oxidoreductase YrpB (nitropropane dioxygenase family)
MNLLAMMCCTGDIPSSILIPACVDLVKGHTSPLTGKPVYVVGAGGVYDGRSLAANLMWGAQGVWVCLCSVFTKMATGSAS